MGLLEAWQDFWTSFLGNESRTFGLWVFSVLFPVVPILAVVWWIGAFRKLRSVQIRVARDLQLVFRTLPHP